VHDNVTGYAGLNINLPFVCADASMVNNGHYIVVELPPWIPGVGSV
jgi:hypothetical protein